MEAPKVSCDLDGHTQMANTITLAVYACQRFNTGLFTKNTLSLLDVEDSSCKPDKEVGHCSNKEYALVNSCIKDRYVSLIVFVAIYVFGAYFKNCVITMGSISIGKDPQEDNTYAYK